jgi:hypothetical protein
MHFSWTGLFLAPLPVPLIACAVMAPLLRGEGPVVLTFLILLIPACVIAYATTIFVFLPGLFLLSLWRPLTRWMACALGFVLGAAVFVPVTWLAWDTGGPNSGPMTEPFGVFFRSWATEPFMLFFPAAGLVTAALYWWFGTRRHSRAVTLAATKN